MSEREVMWTPANSKQGHESSKMHSIQAEPYCVTPANTYNILQEIATS